MVLVHVGDNVRLALGQAASQYGLQLLAPSHLILPKPATRWAFPRPPR